MIVNIPLATGNKLNCFISAKFIYHVRVFTSIILPIARVLFFFVVDVNMLINHLLEKNCYALLNYLENCLFNYIYLLSLRKTSRARARTFTVLNIMLLSIR